MARTAPSDVYILPAHVWLRRFLLVHERVESPIEWKLGMALVNTFSRVAVFDVLEQSQVDCGECLLAMVPQYVWRNYRIDFAICRLGEAVFVECDGHEFHERTREQAQRDRSRDRAIQAAGIGILRFTGREITRDVDACVDEIGQFCDARLP